MGGVERRAAILILKQRAEMLERSDWALHAENLTLPRPVVKHTRLAPPAT